MLALEGAEGLGAGDGLKEMGGGRAAEREQQHLYNHKGGSVHLTG